MAHAVRKPEAERSTHALLASHLQYPIGELANELHPPSVIASGDVSADPSVMGRRLSDDDPGTVSASGPAERRGSVMNGPAIRPG